MFTPSYNPCAARIVRCAPNPNRDEALCCIVEVMNGAAARDLVRLVSIDSIVYDASALAMPSIWRTQRAGPLPRLSSFTLVVTPESPTCAAIFATRPLISCASGLANALAIFSRRSDTASSLSVSGSGTISALTMRGSNFSPSNSTSSARIVLLSPSHPFCDLIVGPFPFSSRFARNFRHASPSAPAFA